jgi:hypothetical protein
MQPSIVIETVTTTGAISTNQDFCSMSGAQLAAFKGASIATIRGLVCTDPNDISCAAEITNTCGSDSRRELVSDRQLQTQTAAPWQLYYQVTNTFTCQWASCASPSDLATATSISNNVATTMTTSMSSGSFLTLLSTALVQTQAFAATIVTCLIVWGTINAQPQTLVGVTGTGKFYPDWENNGDTCLEDGNEPEYMVIDTTWLSDSLEECCARFYNWDTNSCMNVQGSGMWYADQLNGKCVVDCEESGGEMCGGLADLHSDRLFPDARTCCEEKLHWRFTDFCEVSLPNACLIPLTTTMHIAETPLLQIIICRPILWGPPRALLAQDYITVEIAQDVMFVFEIVIQPVSFHTLSLH